MTPLYTARRRAESFRNVEHDGRRSPEQLIPKIRGQRGNDGSTRATSLKRHAVSVEGVEPVNRLMRANAHRKEGGRGGCSEGGVGIHEEILSFPAATIGVAPNGEWLAFTGITPNVDGRVDVYVANPNGLGRVNLTGSRRGQIELLGWVGGQ